MAVCTTQQLFPPAVFHQNRENGPRKRQLSFSFFFPGRRQKIQKSSKIAIFGPLALGLSGRGGAKEVFFFFLRVDASKKSLENEKIRKKRENENTRLLR